MSGSGYLKFRNDRGVPEICIGVREFECIGVSPPQDHPHIYIDMGEADTILCPYCGTRFRFDPRLAPLNATRRTVSLLTITRPARSRGAGQVQSPSRDSAGYHRVSNGTPGSRCCPVRLSTYREEAAPMRSQPLPGEASRRRAEEQFKTTKKVNSETKANTPSRQAEAAKTARLRALRLAKEAADKDTANRGAAAAKARRSEPRRRVRRPQASTPSEPK
jgi:uncharacterized Zn-finger protein